MRNEDYNQILKEHFDVLDNDTRKIMLNINESDQNQVLAALTSKLYDNIVEKIDDIDFGNIPHTKGDITKIENYDKLVDCLKVIEDLLLQMRQPTTCVTTITQAIQNIKDRKELFEKAFRYNTELPIIMYSTMCLSIVSSTSFLIATCIEFIKSPNQDNIDLIIDKVSIVKTKESLLFKGLERFNKSCSNGQFDESMNYVIKTNTKQFTGIEPTVIVGSIALAGLVLNILPLMRELIFFAYFTRTQISDYFEIQAELLQINAYNLEHNEYMNKKDRIEVAKKQYKIVDTLKKISNFFAIEKKRAEKETSNEIQKNTKKFKTDELIDELPDSASSALF